MTPPNPWRPRVADAWRMISNWHAAWITVAMLAALLFIERLRLHAELAASMNPPFAFDPQSVTAIALLHWFIGDLAIAGLCGALIGAVHLITQRTPRLRHAPVVCAIGAVAVCDVTLAVHHRLLFTMHAGLDVATITEFFDAPDSGEVLSAGHAADTAFLLVPLLLMLAFAFANASWQRHASHLARAAGGLGVAVGCVLVILPAPSRPVDRSLRDNALAYVTADVVDNLTRTHVYREWPVMMSAAQRASIALVDPYFVSAAGRAPPPAWPPSLPSPTNVLFFIMESTGSSYIFEEADDGVVMPNLQRLSHLGLFAQQHRSTANSSGSALFSMFTGLYPLPEHAVYAIRDDLRWPTLHALKAGLASRVVTPGRLESFFPRGLLRNNGVQELIGRSELTDMPAGRSRAWAAKDELRTWALFRARLRERTTPFFDVYYSYVPHYDYSDYGERYRARADIRIERNRYLNNLRLLDTMIGQLIGDLTASGKLGQTMVVIVGDHGEAFGQHANNWTHSRHSYEENVRVPLLILYPPMFPPEQVSIPTSHVDLLPTILDALRVAYEPAAFQGESLLRRPFRRSRVFQWGNEGTLSTITSDGSKTVINLYSDSCVVFRLPADAGETSPLTCQNANHDTDAIAAFRDHQLTDLGHWPQAARRP